MSAHREGRRRVNPERVVAVAMLLIGAFIGGYRWTLPGPAGWAEYVVRGFCVMFALVCLVGAYDLWSMGRRR